MEVKDFELLMWEAAKERDPIAFLNVVSNDAIMVCGGYHCSGEEYAQFIADFDIAEYHITDFEKIVQTEEICQVHYVISTTVQDKRNLDLEGKFHITSTWKKTDDTWKLIFNMDAR